MIKALIANKNNPMVKKVIGIVKIVKIGFTTAFKNANTTATKIADKKPFISIPGSSLAVITTATADINMFARNFTGQKYRKF